MFWIHGGDLQYGSGSNDDYDGSSLAANQDVVVVTINYRLNVYGFPGSPEIPIDARNLGFLDQRKALDWVQQNVGAFGGDPTKVTIFGESAGGYSVKELFAVPPDPLPFRAAIMQSLGATLTPNGTANWETLASALGCSNATSPLACMQAADATRITLIIEENELRFPPVVDNQTRISHAEDAMHAGTTAQIPLMIGNNADEGSSFASSYANAQALLEYTLPNDTSYQAAVLASYPPGLQGANLTAQILTDSSFTCGSSFFANVSGAAGLPTWRYFFNASFPNTDVFPGAGAYHTAEIPLVFGTFPREGSTERQARLSTVMQKAWADFAKDPAGGPGWPAAGAGGHGVMVFGGLEGGLASTVSSEALDGMCTVWETMNEMLGI
ncbi:hypothetical protein W97_08595 [Neofusicoccum parvum]|uniref:Uncharacterized protein n=1 Tax=Neofusicoccum parvum TaxID=310453 RepID=A0ACB5SLI4_9PEZI|nr:hypothetical protein W97_08595 [Neofusicoccum parvum]